MNTDSNKIFRKLIYAQDNLLLQDVETSLDIMGNLPVIVYPTAMLPILISFHISSNRYVLYSSYYNSRDLGICLFKTKEISLASLLDEMIKGALLVKKEDDLLYEKLDKVNDKIKAVVNLIEYRKNDIINNENSYFLMINKDFEWRVTNNDKNEIAIKLKDNTYLYISANVSENSKDKWSKSKESIYMIQFRDEHNIIYSHSMNFVVLKQFLYYMKDKNQSDILDYIKEKNNNAYIIMAS